MGSKMGQYPQMRDENSWPLHFSKRRDLHDEKIQVEEEKNFGGDGNDLDIFYPDEDAASCEVDVSKDYCRDINPEDVRSGNGKAGHRKAIWLDDRVSSSSPGLEQSENARQYPNPLTASEFFQTMKEPRFNHRDLRRLIYTADLDPACIHALTATVSYHRAMVLRNAIYKHLAFQASIAVKLSSAGFLTFQLDLHIPFFLLRKSAPPGESERKINKNPLREWTDLSFLNLDTPESQGQEPEKVWGILGAQFSCVITGSDDWRWTAYGFVDTEYDGFPADLTEDDLRFDQIAGGGLVEANKPICRPRDYWLKVFEVRIVQARREWEYLIYKMELGVKQYRTQHPVNLSRRSGTAGERAIEKESFDWALQLKDLLRELGGTLSSITEAWESFNSDGDIGYVRDNVSSHTIISLHNIKTTFRELQGYRRRITKINEFCSDFSTALELRLTLESKEAADKNGVTAEFMVSILYPVALAAAIFSMQKGVIPLDPNPRSFVFTLFILILMTYAARFVILPLLQKIISLWTKIKTFGESGDKISGKTSAGIFSPIRGAGIISDEERNAP